jgi:hypothetical protein
MLWAQQSFIRINEAVIGSNWRNPKVLASLLTAVIILSGYCKLSHSIKKNCN